MTSARAGRAVREPLSLRVLPADRALIDRAAAAAGLNRTDFVIGASRDRAHHVLAEQTYIALDPAAFAAFAEQVDAPPAPNPQLARTLSSPAPWE